MPDREKAIKAVETCFNSWIDKHRNMGYDLQAVELAKRDALALLKEQEAVVRCKDCIYFDSYRCTNDMVLQRIDDCGCHPSFYVYGDWFCADGERR